MSEYDRIWPELCDQEMQASQKSIDWSFIRGWWIIWQKTLISRLNQLYEWWAAFCLAGSHWTISQTAVRTLWQAMWLQNGNYPPTIVSWRLQCHMTRMLSSDWLAGSLLACDWLAGCGVPTGSLQADHNLLLWSWRARSRHAELSYVSMWAYNGIPRISDRKDGLWRIFMEFRDAKRQLVKLTERLFLGPCNIKSLKRSLLPFLAWMSNWDKTLMV